MRFILTHELRDLPAPVHRLAARAGAVVSVMQSVPYHPPVVGPGRGRIETGPGYLHRYDALLRQDLAVPVSGLPVGLCLDPEARRIGLVSWSREAPRSTDVEIIDAMTGGPVASKGFEDASVFGIALSKDLVVLGRHVRCWTPEHGPKVELRSPDLESVQQALDVDDAGFDVGIANDVVVGTGIDLHVWWPRSTRAPFSLHQSIHSPPGEVGSCEISDDGRRVAIRHDRRGGQDEAARVLDLDDLEAPPTRICPPGSKQPAMLALSPDGLHVALVLGGTDQVLVYRATDGTEVAQFASPGLTAIAWLDPITLVVGGSTLSLWRSG